MKMKISKLIGAVILTAITSLNLNVRAQEQPVDGEQAAASFLRMEKTRYYLGGFYFTRYVDNVAQTNIGAQYTMTATGEVTKLQIGDKEIPLDKPLLGLPVNTLGQAVNFIAWVTGYSSNGNSTCHGYFNTNLLNPGDPIAILLRPEFIHKFISFTPPPGVSSDNLSLNHLTDWGAEKDGYNQWKNGFDVWLDPLKGPVDYKVVDGSTGRAYSADTLNPIALTDPAPNTGSIVSFNRVGGAVEIPSNAGTSAEHQRLDALVTRDERALPAKVFYCDLNGGFIEIYHNYGLEIGSAVEVFDLTDDGAKALVSSAIVGNGASWPIITPGIHGKVIITVTGTLNPNGQSTGFGLSFYSYKGVYNPAPNTSDGSASPTTSAPAQ